MISLLNHGPRVRQNSVVVNTELPRSTLWFFERNYSAIEIVHVPITNGDAQPFIVDFPIKQVNFQFARSVITRGYGYG